MKKGLCEAVFILDRSGSMGGLESDTVGGFNSMLKKQKNTEGTALVTTVLFNQKSHILHDRLDINEVKPLTEDDYEVGGTTALLDAIGGTINHISGVHKYIREEDRPENTIFVITTDGMENSSKEYSADQVRRLIEKQKSKAGWEFIFLGANIDAVETASRFGIDKDHTADFHADEIGIGTQFEAVDAAIRSVRSSGKLKGSWKKAVDADYRSRKG
ncbi:MAG: vWA domain-containing protein [Eubacteriales bacterium]|jgi:uncharacterized protein YegL